MDSGFLILELLLIFVVPGIAAAIVKGGAGRKVVWYLGTGALVYLTDALVPIANVLLSIGASFKELDRGAIELVTMFAMLAVDVTMITLAARTGKICAACQSRIHSKATRCPRCQVEIPAQTPESRKEISN